uniref:Microtubule associated tumor suppressor 1b n=1 Tax=Oryzias latipes TaxID=8090 RepID=A0A3P9LIL4_ORYLA
MANAVVSLRSAQLRPFGWNPITHHHLLLQTPPPRPGPRARQQEGDGRGDRGTAPPPGTGTGPPGPAEGGSGSPPQGEQSQTQSVPEPCSAADRAPQSPAGPAGPASKPAANQQSAGRAAASKLPVKGWNPGPAGGGGTSGAAGRGSPAVNQQPLRRTLSPPGSSAPQRPPVSRSRASAARLKPPTTAKAAISQTAARAPPAGGLLQTKQSAPFQRSGSARFSRLGAAVDRNQAREAPRPPNGSSQICPSAAGNQQNQHNWQNQQNQPLELVRLLLRSAESDLDLHLKHLRSSIDLRFMFLIPSVTAGLSRTALNNWAQTPTQNVPDQCLLSSSQVSDVTNGNSSGSAILPAADPPSPTGPAGSGFRTRTGPRSNTKTATRLQNASRPGVGGAADKQNQNKETEGKNQAVVQLRRLLLQGNRRVEALATVIQHLFSAREEALKQKTELSAQLSGLREELAASAQSCQRLQREKEEARLSFEESLRRQQEQHREELQQLEDRLKTFYQAEWDRALQEYQQEADRFQASMEQQLEELRSRHEEELRSQEACHSQRVESVRQQQAASVEEMRSVHQGELQELRSALKETQTSLEDRISALTAETEDLSQKLRAEEERRRQILSDKNLKDSHTVYLERELESLKVVLELKNKQLHQKEKKLMEMEKLAEANVKLEETLTKVQQENEDYKARMDKHAALSRQLSTEQALLQQTLQKESKVNKRLSMENEELLWKLHNGDLLASPRRLSPYGSPRNSASFPTAAPLSPR